LEVYDFVLVHGAWHDGSAWNAVAEQLRANGHRAWAPTIAGHGRKVPKNVTHDECVQSIADFIEGSDLRHFILIGHSFGGTIISRLAPRMPERIRRLVFWNALVPLDGESMVSAAPPQMAALLAHLANISTDNTVVLPFELWRDGMINDVDLQAARGAYEQLSPQPYRPFTEALDMKAFYGMRATGKPPCSYLNATEDSVLDWRPRISSRLGLFRLVQMPGSHELLFSNPVGLAAKLIEAGRD
jgi:pimeloyl-ACP methyl ester carboxylesterase